MDRRTRTAKRPSLPAGIVFDSSSPSPCPSSAASRGIRWPRAKPRFSLLLSLFSSLSLSIRDEQRRVRHRSLLVPPRRGRRRFPSSSLSFDRWQEVQPAVSIVRLGMERREGQLGTAHCLAAVRRGAFGQSFASLRTSFETRGTGVGHALSLFLHGSTPCSICSMRQNSSRHVSMGRMGKVSWKSLLN